MHQLNTNKQISLEKLIDTEQLQELSVGFAELVGIGIKVFAEDKKRLVDVRIGSSDYQAYLYNAPALKQIITNTVNQIQNMPLPEQNTSQHIRCESGQRYAIHPIYCQGDLIGRIVFGPYRNEADTNPPDSIFSSDTKLDRTKTQLAWEGIRIYSEQALTAIIDYFSTTIDIIAFNASKSALTSSLHLESTTSSYKELIDKNKDLLAANQKLQELDQLKSNFVATVSHELRTPLTSVIGYSEMLLENMAGPLNKEQTEYVSTILEKGESLLNLISQILDLSRIEAGNAQLNIQSADIDNALTLSLSDVKPQAEKKEIHIQINKAQDIGNIEIDTDKIRLVLTNILGNAVKFTPEGGSIGIEIYNIDEPPQDLCHGYQREFDLFEPERNRFLRMDIQDSGIGIPDNKLQQVFESFFQVDNSSTRKFGGSGLGLAISKNFIQAHGGCIFAHSEEGQGSTFTIILPYVNTDIPNEGTSI